MKLNKTLPPTLHRALLAAVLDHLPSVPTVVLPDIKAQLARAVLSRIYSMDDLTNELKEKFRTFHKVYKLAFQEMIDEGLHGSIAAVRVWERSLNLVPLTQDELMRFKIYIATRGTKSGDLFA